MKRWNSSDIEALLPNGDKPGRPEDATLDYKACHWSVASKGATAWEWRHECAKDVAALANHIGGHILLGIAEDTSTVPAQTLPGKVLGVKGSDPVKQTKDALANCLEPPELARQVDVYPVEVLGVQVLVVAVPPSAEALALVRVGKAPDRMLFAAPIRDGDQTKYLGRDEMERRMSIDGRRVSLLVRGWLEGKAERSVHVHVSSGVWVRVFGRVDDTRVHVRRDAPELDSVAYPGSLSEGGFTIAMTVSEVAEKQLEDTRRVGGGFAGKHPHVVQEHDLFIPWSRIADAWMRESGGRLHLHLLLRDVRIVWFYGRYLLD